MSKMKEELMARPQWSRDLLNMRKVEKNLARLKKSAWRAGRSPKHPHTARKTLLYVFQEVECEVTFGSIRVTARTA